MGKHSRTWSWPKTPSRLPWPWLLLARLCRPPDHIVKQRGVDSTPGTGAAAPSTPAPSEKSRLPGVASRARVRLLPPRVSPGPIHVIGADPGAPRVAPGEGLAQLRGEALPVVVAVQGLLEGGFRHHPGELALLDVMNQGLLVPPPHA